MQIKLSLKLRTLWLTRRSTLDRQSLRSEGTSFHSIRDHPIQKAEAGITNHISLRSLAQFLLKVLKCISPFPLLRLE